MLLYDSNPTTSPDPTPRAWSPAANARRPVDHSPIRDDLIPEDGEGLVRCAVRMMLEHGEPVHVRPHHRPRVLHLVRRHTRRYPPSTLSTVPVTKAAASEARNW